MKYEVTAPGVATAVMIVLVWIFSRVPEFTVRHGWMFPTFGALAIIAVAWLLVSALRASAKKV